MISPLITSLFSIPSEKNVREYIAVFLVLITTNVGWIFGMENSTPIYYVNFIILPLFLISLAKYCPKLDALDYFVLSFMLLSFVGLFKTHIYDNQPFLNGLKAIKFNFLTLFYFYFRYSNLKFHKVMQAILFFGFVVSFVIVFASLTENRYLMEISQMNIEHRLALTRYILGIPLICFCAIYYYICFLHTNQKNMLFKFLYFSIVIVFIFQTRIVFIGLAPVFIFSYFKVARKKFFLNIVIAITFVTVLLSQILIADSALMKFYQMSHDDVSKSDRDVTGYSARVNSHAHFLKDFLKHPVLGTGDIWRTIKDSEVTDDNGTVVYEDDLGVAAVLYKYGILGALWIFTFFVIVLIKKRDCKNNIYLLSFYSFFVFCLVAGTTLNFFTDRKNEIFIFVMFALFVRLHSEITRSKTWPPLNTLQGRS